MGRRHGASSAMSRHTVLVLIVPRGGRSGWLIGRVTGLGNFSPSPTQPPSVAIVGSSREWTRGAWLFVYSDHISWWSRCSVTRFFFQSIAESSLESILRPGLRSMRPTSSGWGRSPPPDSGRRRRKILLVLAQMPTCNSTSGEADGRIIRSPASPFPEGLGRKESGGAVRDISRSSPCATVLVGLQYGGLGMPRRCW